MTWKLLLLIVLSVSLSALAQISLKYGMSLDSVQRALKNGVHYLAAAKVVLFNIYVLGGFMMYGLGALIWLLVLARLDVSVAYPFVGLGFILTMLLGLFVLGEPLKLLRVAGTVLVVIGVTLVART